MKHDLSCQCGKIFQVVIEEEVNLDENPTSLNSILDGSFMSFICPACKKKHKPEFRILLIWKSKNLKLEVLPEMDRGEFYRRKKEDIPYETVIGFPEMSDRISVLKDDLEPVIIEALKSCLLAKAEENYPSRETNIWYRGKGPAGIEFHLDGIRAGEVAVMRVPDDLYKKMSNNYIKHPKSEPFSLLRVRSYMSVQNILRPDALK
ncbi:MAG: CpXC domain-containing protein [Treponema sp.]|nr:CpXC domain-containing protein [Treponema sp.]MCL2271360.1 CpXC domain-containing protein [Treponema sp.]